MHVHEHGVSTAQRYLFVIDGAKALRAAIREVFGAEQPVELPEPQDAQRALLEISG